LILGLWGILVYQYLGEGETSGSPRMQYLANPYKGKALPTPSAAEESLAENLAREKVREEPPALEVAAARSPLSFIRSLPTLPHPISQAPKPRIQARLRRETPIEAEPQVPPGFFKTVTPHFSIYSEASLASPDFIALIESIHANLMLDLAAFSPWTEEARVSLFLFKNQETYRSVTGRPVWSGGASSVAKHRVYVYESEELPGILSHELCHIYYDGFYLSSGHINPLWLSEGMATLTQVERGLAAPEWLGVNLDILANGGGFSLDDLMSVTTTADASDDKARLWYAESYSLVRFLLRSQYKSNFFKFSEYVRDGKEIPEALYRAYGMPFNRIKALEYAWRHDLTSRKIAKLSDS
jgi:hypothetical protein